MLNTFADETNSLVLDVFRSAVSLGVSRVRAVAAVEVCASIGYTASSVIAFKRYLGELHAILGDCARRTVVAPYLQV